MIEVEEKTEIESRCGICCSNCDFKKMVTVKDAPILKNLSGLISAL